MLAEDDVPAVAGEIEKLPQHADIAGEGFENLVLPPDHPMRNRLLTAILILLVLNAFAAAAVLVVPLILAILLSLMLAPAVRLLCHWHLPRVLSTLLVLLGTFAIIGSLLASLVAPAQSWMALEVPKSFARIELAMGNLRGPLQAASHASDQLSRLTNLDGDSKPQRFVDAGPSRLAQMLSATPAILTSATVTLLLIFIFLLHGDALLRKCVELAPALHIKKDIVLASRSAQHELSTYMVTITLINVSVGLVCAFLLWALGVSDPLLWGGAAAMLNFAPFIGPMLIVMLLVLVGFSRFTTPLAALSVPSIFLLLHFLESQLITPLIIGRRLALDPVVVILSLMLLGWLWGVAGLLMAVPLLTCVRIVAERIPGWAILAKVLGT